MGYSNFAEVGSLFLCSGHGRRLLTRNFISNFGVRVYQRADGTMLHGDDCPVGLAARQWRRIKNFAGAAASLALLLLGVNRANAGSQTGSPSVIEKQVKVIMGAVPAPTPNPTPTPAPKPTATPPSDKK